MTAPGIPGKQAPSSCAECRRSKAKCSFGELEDGTTEATGRVAKRTRRATAADVRSDDDEEEAEEESVKRPAKRVRKAASKTISIQETDTESVREVQGPMTPVVVKREKGTAREVDRVETGTRESVAAMENLTAAINGMTGAVERLVGKVAQIEKLGEGLDDIKWGQLELVTTMNKIAGAWERREQGKEEVKKGEVEMDKGEKGARVGTADAGEGSTAANDGDTEGGNENVKE